MKSALLWIHAICASLWVLSSLCLAVAGAALLGEEGEHEDFVRRVVPGLNWLAVGAAVILLLSGVGNVMVVARQRHFELPPRFAVILAVKVTLFLLMVVALARSWRLLGRWRRAAGASRKSTLAHLVAMAGVIALMGGVAMALGLWLVGS